MKKSLFIIFITLVFTLIGCASSYNWSKKNPLYKQSPYKELYITGLQNAFVLTRSKWFAKRLNFGDSTQIKATQFCAKSMETEFRKRYANLNVLPDSVLAKFPEESQKLDDRIFVKGILPEQGIAITDSANNIIPQILLIHEVIIGTDLKREDYFDYALIHNESDNKKKNVENISAIISYTLWDNVKQLPLYTAVNEIQHPITTLSENDLNTLMQLSVERVTQNLYNGARL